MGDKRTKKQFSKIYDKNIDKIYRFIYLKTGSKARAEDLASEAFLKAYKNFAKRKNNPEAADIKNPRAFLYQVARSTVADYYRKEGDITKVNLEDAKDIESSEDIHKEAEISLDANKAKSALSNIKENYKEIIILRYIEEYSNSEIAEILGKSEGATRVMLHRALNSLKEEIEAEKVRTS